MNPTQIVQKWLFSYRPSLEFAIPSKLALMLLGVVLGRWMVGWMALFGQSKVDGLSPFDTDIDAADMDMDGQYRRTLMDWDNRDAFEGKWDKCGFETQKLIFLRNVIHPSTVVNTPTSQFGQWHG